MGKSSKDPFQPKAICFYIKNKSHEKVFNIMTKYAKNIYNCTIFCYNVYLKYKNDIFKDLHDKLSESKIPSVKKDKQNFINNELFMIFDKYHLKYSDSFKDLINNNKVIFDYIINDDELNQYKVFNSNLSNIRDIYHKELKDHNKIKYNSENKKLVYTDVIDNIINSFYRRNYFMTKNELLNHKKLTIKNKAFIKHVKTKDGYLLNNNEGKWRQKVKDEFWLSSEQSMISSLTLRHIGENRNKLPGHIIGKITNKAYTGIQSYYGLKSKGIRANRPKFLGKNELYNIVYDSTSYRINNNKIKLTVGKYIGTNYDKLVDSTFLNLSDPKYEWETTKPRGTKYVKLNHARENKPENKGFTTLYVKPGFVYYVKKSNPNIIDAKYLNLTIPQRLLEHMENNSKNGKSKIKTIEVVPVLNYKFKIVITYKSIYKKRKIKKEDLDDYKINDSISIDLGMKNLMTIYDPKETQHMIKGGVIKSINEYYTNKISYYTSSASDHKNKQTNKRIKKLWIRRNNSVNDYFNKVVNTIYKRYNDKSFVILGYNENWKDKVNMGTHKNKLFTQIPYAQLITKLTRKLNDNKKDLTKVEESYTSKCDALSLEELKKKKKYNGVRKKGIYISQGETVINSDLNGAINISRKFYKDRIKKITGKKLCNPTRIKVMLQ